MALSDSLKGGVNPAPTSQAPTPDAGGSTPPTPPQDGKSVTGKNTEHERFLAEGHALRSKMTPEEKQLEGSKSDKVAFVAALGDPNKPQYRKEEKKDIPSYVVVGYAFKALEDMEIPRANLKRKFANFMDVEPMDTETVKAGETFYLNVFETGALISQTPYAGTFSGEGTAVTLSLKHSQNRTEPLPVLNKQGKGSIKENMILIADMVGADPANKVKGKPQIKPEFASKFSVLYEKRDANGKRGNGAGAKAAGETTKDLAFAFQNYLKKK